MAQKYEAELNGVKGVWRTIGGRRVFIRTGQSLSSAMKESGKFKKKDIGNIDKKYIKKVADAKDEEDLKKADEYYKEKTGENWNEGREGNSNRKEVRDKIQKHIKEYYEDNEEDFIHDMEAQNYGNNVTPYHWGRELAKNGMFLVYNEDVDNFLKDLKINPKGKKYNSSQSFEEYAHLIGRESARMYERYKKKK